MGRVIIPVLVPGQGRHEVVAGGGRGQTLSLALCDDGVTSFIEEKEIWDGDVMGRVEDLELLLLLLFLLLDNEVELLGLVVER